MTKNNTATLEPSPMRVDGDAHDADLKRIRAQQAANREEQLRCLNPAYAAQREHEKPVYKWTVHAEWLGIGKESEGIIKMQSEQTVTAQNERDAWSAFCDSIGVYPSRRDARPIIKRGKQLSVQSVVAAHVAGVEADSTIPTVVVGPIAKRAKR